MQIIEERLRFNMQYLQLVKMVAGILYLMHLFGCGWFYLHLSVYERVTHTDGRGDGGGVQTDAEVYTWLTEYDGGSGVHATVWVQYLDSIYWALMTLTTVCPASYDPAPPPTPPRPLSTASDNHSRARPHTSTSSLNLYTHTRAHILIRRSGMVTSLLSTTWSGCTP